MFICHEIQQKCSFLFIVPLVLILWYFPSFIFCVFTFMVDQNNLNLTHSAFHNNHVITVQHKLKVLIILKNFPAKHLELNKTKSTRPPLDHWPEENRFTEVVACSQALLRPSPPSSPECRWFIEKMSLWCRQTSLCLLVLFISHPR